MILQPIDYRPTRDDRLWLLRAVQAEGPVHAQVAQALINRFTLLRHRDPSLYPTLAGFVRAYAQPVNPRWMRGGDKLRAALERADTDGRRRLQMLAAKRAEHSARTQFDAEVVAAVDRALTAGPVDLPAKDVTDYAAAAKDASSYLEPRTAPRRGRNRLWTAAPGWPGYRVEIRPGVVAPGNDSTAPLLLALGLVIVVAVAIRGG